MAYDRVLIRDLRSRNGVRVNGRLVEEARLHTGDELAIGPILFRFELETEASDASVSPSARRAPVTSAARPGPMAPVLNSATPAPQPSRPDSDIDLVPIDDL